MNRISLKPRPKPSTPQNPVLFAETAYPQLIEKYVGGELVILGTDGHRHPGGQNAGSTSLRTDNSKLSVQNP